MSNEQAQLDTSPFHILEKPLLFVSYRSQREAVTFLKQTYGSDHGLGVFHGAPASGKRSLIQHYVDRLPADAMAAVVDAAGLDAQTFLETLMYEYGLDMHGSSVNVMMNMVKVFAVQQTSVRHAPLLVIRKFNAMTPEAVQIVSQLVKLTFQNQSALRLVLVSDVPLDRMLAAPGLQAISARKTGEHELGGMTRAETAHYLDAKLRCAGVVRPETVISATATDEIYNETGGRPGSVDKCVLERLAGARKLPLQAVSDDEWATPGDDSPRLIITKDGKTIGTIALDTERVLIGRAKYNDVTIDSTFISRHHALLVRDEGKTVIADLNSTNGTFVNSERIIAHGLRHDDVISLGNHGIKLFDPNSRQRATPDEDSFIDTATMKALCNIRNSDLHESLQLPNLKNVNG